MDMPPANQHEVLRDLQAEGPPRADIAIESTRPARDGIFDIPIPPHPELSVRRVELVLDVLCIYRLIEIYLQEHPEDEDTRRHRLGHFRGFDETSEHFELLLTRFLIEREHKFTEQRAYQGDGDFASAVPMRADYERLLNTWRELGSPDNLTSEHLRALLA